MINPVYQTKLGKIYCGDSLQIMKTINNDSIDLIITSPPYAILDSKSYGNPDQSEYNDWLIQFIHEFKRIIKSNGSIIINIGGSWNKNSPTRSLYNYKLLIRICEEVGLYLAQDIFWFNPSRFTTTEYALRRKIRLKDAIEYIWWFSKTKSPKSDCNKVLLEYSDHFKKTLKFDLAERWSTMSYSGLDIHSENLRDNGGALPMNMIYCANADSQDKYFKACKENGINSHPARFPKQIPAFFISMLTDPNDLIYDPFGGSMTTGFAAEQLQRKWICSELSMEYIQGGILRFETPNEVKQEKGIFD